MWWAVRRCAFSLYRFWLFVVSCSDLPVHNFFLKKMIGYGGFQVSPPANTSEPNEQLATRTFKK